MATVSSTLQLIDSFTDPLKQVVQAMNMTITVMNHLNSATGNNASITHTLTLARQRLTNAETAFNSISQRATDAQNNLNREMKSGSSLAKDLAKSISDAVKKYTGLDGLKLLANATIVPGMEMVKTKDMFQAQLGSDALGSEMFEQVTKDALRDGVKLEDYMKGTLGNLSFTKNIGQLSEMNRLANQISMFDTSGKGLEGAYSAIKDVMKGDVTALSKQFNPELVKKFNLADLGKQGDVSGVLAGINQLMEASGKGKEAMQKMMDSPAEQWTALLNNLQTKLALVGMSAVEAFGPALARLNEAFSSGKFDPLFASLKAGLNVVGQAIGMLIDGFIAIYDWIVANWSMIEPLLVAIAFVYFGMLIAQLAVAIVELYAMGVAWLAALAPVILIVLAVWALITVLNYFGVSTADIVGFVAGLFMTLFASIWNGVAFVYNIFASFAEFLINLFIDPLYAIRKLFYDLAMTFLEHMYNMLRGAEDFAGGFMTTVLEAINKVISGINWLVDLLNEIPGFNIPKVELFDPTNIHSMSDRVKNLMDQMEKPTSSKDVVSIKRMETMDLKGSFDSGFSAGSNLVNSFSMSDLFSSSDKSKEQNGFGAGAGGEKGFGAGAGGGTAAGMPSKIDEVGRVGQIGGTVDIASEDLKIMRELAEMKNIQNFVSLQPTVSVQTGDITNGYDIDTIVRRIEKSLEEQIATSAAGVYA